MEPNYLDLNRSSWNKRTDIHYSSDFYDVKGFLAGNTSLKDIELELLGDISGKKILHLQCHFGQDTLSLGRMGAEVTGVDLSDRAIEKANELAKDAGIEARFICCDIYDLPNHLDEKFDIIFTSYGTIGWLPDLTKWASVIRHFLKPGGEFIFVEFHPVVWMFDDDFQNVAYNYFNKEVILETEAGTYADRDADIHGDYVMWNHDLSEVINSLLEAGLQLDSFNEFNYSPFNCFKHTVEYELGRFRIAHLGDRIPMTYSLKATLTK